MFYNMEKFLKIRSIPQKYLIFNKFNRLQLLFGIFTIILLGSIMNVKGQNKSGKSPKTQSTSTANITNASGNTTPDKTTSKSKKSNKIVGWAVEVRSISSTFDAYVGFNSGGLTIVVLGMPMYNYAPNTLAGGTKCQFDINNKLFHKTQSVIARIQPQKWKIGYGDNATIALRVTITYHHQGDEPSTVYETWWKGTKEMPDDLRQILQLKDKISDDNKAQCQKEINK